MLLCLSPQGIPPSIPRKISVVASIVELELELEIFYLNATELFPRLAEQMMVSYYRSSRSNLHDILVHGDRSQKSPTRQCTEVILDRNCSVVRARDLHIR